MTTETHTPRLTFPRVVPPYVRAEVTTLAPQIVAARSACDAATYHLDVTSDLYEDVEAGVLADGFSVPPLTDNALVSAREKASAADETYDGLLTRLYELCQGFDNLADSVLDDLLS